MTVLLAAAACSSSSPTATPTGGNDSPATSTPDETTAGNTPTTIPGQSPESDVARSPATVPPVPEVDRPDELMIESVGIDAEIQPVTLAQDGQMELPPDPDVLGWYQYGPAPGDPTGSAVFGGHLDSQEHGIGQLASLRDSEVGDPIVVSSESGRTMTYEVVDVRSVQQDDVRLERLFQRAGEEQIVMVTCGGDYDPEEGYEENLIVVGEPS